MYQIQYDILGRCFILISNFFFLCWNFSYFLNDQASLFCGPALLVLISTIWIPTDAPTDRISDAADFFVQHRADPLGTATAILQFKQSFLHYFFTICNYFSASKFDYGPDSQPFRLPTSRNKFIKPEKTTRKDDDEEL